MANWQGALGGASTGATTGAGIGSIFGPVGTGIGAALGGLGGGLAGYFLGKPENAGQAGNELYDYLFGTPEGVRMLNQFSPDQQKALHDLLGKSMSQYDNPYQGFDPIKQSILSDYRKNIIPGIAEQFAGSGNNAATSGTFHSALSSSAADLGERLAYAQANYGLANRGQALQALQLGLTPQYTRGVYESQGTPGFIQNAGRGIENYLSARDQAKFKDQLLELLRQGQNGGSTGVAGVDKNKVAQMMDSVRNSFLSARKTA